MPRYARVHVTGGLFHVICRFQDKQYFLDLPGARERYLELLGKAASTHDARIIAYCLMSSHIHLVIQAGNDPIGQLTKKVNAPFGAWLNRQRGGMGTVFADRPRSVLVHDETYGLELVRYVHNNPVRAQVTPRASKSDWSSHRCYAGLSPCPPWLATEAVLGPNHAEHEAIRADFVQFVDVGRNEKCRPEFSGEISRKLSARIRKLLGGDVALSCPVLGPDSFVTSALGEQVKKQQEQLQNRTSVTDATEVVAAVFRYFQLDPDLAGKRIRPKAVARARALAAWLWVEVMGRPQVMVADAMRLRRPAVSKMLRQLRGEGLSAEERDAIQRVYRQLTSTDDDTENGTAAARPEMGVPKIPAPTVFALKRNRNQ